ncbi:MAG: GreA/GreB family elongation factor [Bdellovibrionales bacterium]|nr:GreA/GreB family elongation factor [Bdellovibrionales bacterium]
MDKVHLFENLIAQLESKLDFLIREAKFAKEASTHEDAKAENKYDTRSIESSYLAGAQAKRVRELKEDIFKLKKADINPSENGPINIGHIVTVKDLSNNSEKILFLLPAAAGEKIKVDDREVQVITIDSPLGKKLLGKYREEDFEVVIKNKSVEYLVITYL